MCLRKLKRLVQNLVLPDVKLLLLMMLVAPYLDQLHLSKLHVLHPKQL